MSLFKSLVRLENEKIKLTGDRQFCSAKLKSLDIKIYKIKNKLRSEANKRFDYL
jgi:hypothetical protein